MPKLRDLSAATPEDLRRMVRELEQDARAFEQQYDELRDTQRELEDLYQQFSDLYDFAPVGYLTLDRNMVITRANLTIATMLGVERGRLIGKSFYLFIHPLSRDAFFVARRADTRWSGEVALRKADGSELRVSIEVTGVAGVAYEDGSWRCAVIDITAPYVAEQRLRASEERYRGLAEQLVDGIFVTDPQGRYVDANHAGCGMLGYSLDELKELTVQDVLAPAELPKLPEQFYRLANWEIVRNEWSFRRKDGSTFVGELVALQLPDGRLQGVVRDLTQQKRSEQALRRRLEFERFLFGLSRTFIGLPEAEVDVHMQRGLAQVAKFLEMDRITLLELSDDRTEMTVTYWWSADGTVSAPPAITRAAQPWWVSQVLQGKVSLASDLDDLPYEAVAEQQFLRERGIASAASIPLEVGGEIAGAISFITVRRHVTWTEELVSQLRAIGDILWNALKRRQAMQTLLAAQAVVRESEERFRLAMSNIAAGVYTLDLNGMVTYVNPAAEAMFGWTNAELLGRRMHDVTHYKHPDGTPYPISECPSLQILQGDMELREHDEMFIRRDGSFFPVVFSASPLKKDGTTVGVVVGFRDDTPRRDAERALREREALRASEERYRGLAEQVVDGIIVISAEGRALDANSVACDMFGYTLDELKGRSIEDGIADEDLPRLRKSLKRLAREKILRDDWHLKRKDGSVFAAEVVGRQLPDGRLQAVVRDITERKRVEQERADEARRKDEFLAFLGHELRNPLAAVHTAIQVLSRGVSPESRSRMEAIIARQTALMRRLVDDLLEHERITHGHIQLKRHPIDLAACLNRAAAAVQATVSSRSQELTLRLPSEPLQFMADGTRLDQIVGNLLTNASKYTAQGGRIELSGGREGSSVVIRCKDNGQGVPREYQQKIFEPFARGPKTELGYGEASVGLGLALVKQLTELHGGTISIDSAGAGLGSEFTLQLPFLAAENHAAAEAPAPAGAPHRARSVVIVEDNPSVGTTLKAALEQAGHSVRLYDDGPSALAGVSEAAADVVVIDIGLPGMDGYELAAALAQHESARDALRIAVSGFKRRKQASAAFDHYFNKPVDVPALLTLLDEQLR